MKDNKIINQIANKWQNVYWFARMLINNDKYGSIGKNNKLLSTVASSLRIIYKDNKAKKEDEILKIQKQSLKNILTERFSKAKTRLARINKLIEDLDTEIHNLKDMEVFILTCENVMLPINQAIKNIPSDDKEFTLSIAKLYLDVQGEKGLATVVNLWDNLGVRCSLTAERTDIIKAFATLKALLSKDNELNEDDKDIVLTASVQEFERRILKRN